MLVPETVAQASAKLAWVLFQEDGDDLTKQGAGPSLSKTGSPSVTQVNQTYYVASLNSEQCFCLSLLNSGIAAMSYCTQVELFVMGPHKVPLQHLTFPPQQDLQTCIVGHTYWSLSTQETEAGESQVRH
ncbi:hypothetical protein U0070_002634 [Myodes glareolus]|uniref:Uncharacterized protein n=1 Tax=Myodes glareolus TaxID=447135 RepID=A0AAW0IY77_MYOGA